jgi:hypothetical protein
MIGLNVFGIRRKKERDGLGYRYFIYQHEQLQLGI